MWSRPVFFAFRILGAEVCSVEFGPSQVPTDPPKLEGGPGGSHEIGFVMDQMPIIAKNSR